MASRPTTVAGRAAVVQRPHQPPDAAQRKCNKCGIVKTPADFYVRYGSTLHMATCKECKKAYGREYHAKRSADGAAYAETRRAYWLREKYDLTPDDYDRLWQAQGGVCAICSQAPPRRLHVDHNHETGTVRGLLCDLCNRALGLLKDSVASAEALVGYLHQHEER